jgi:hypothetical protein
MHWWKLVRIQRVNLSFVHKIGKGNKHTHTHTFNPLYRLVLGMSLTYFGNVLTLGHTETTTPPVACTMHWMPGMTQLWMNNNPLGLLLLPIILEHPQKCSICDDPAIKFLTSKFSYVPFFFPNPPPGVTANSWRRVLIANHLGQSIITLIFANQKQGAPVKAYLLLYTLLSLLASTTLIFPLSPCHWIWAR